MERKFLKKINGPKKTKIEETQTYEIRSNIEVDIGIIRKSKYNT